MTSSNFMQSQITSFRKAVSTNNKQSIEKHLSNVKNLSEAELNQALFTCIENFRIDQQTDQCLFLLLRNKANPNCQINGQTPLIAACKIAQISLVKNLIQNGAKPDLCNSEGKHPLEFILNSRKQNYDIAEYLISMVNSANIQIGKTSALVVSVQKQFSRIFKMLVERGANLILNNEQSILHVITKQKFKDNIKKKKFLKELSNRGYLSQTKDKFGKLPIDYEADDAIRNYYQQIFKPKIKLIVQKQKDHHPKLKQKELIIHKEVSRQKQQKKKTKDEEPQVVLQEQGVQQQQNDEESFQTHIVQEEDKEKIVELIQQQDQQRKNQQDKDKNKKALSKILAPTVIVNSKKVTKNPVKFSCFGEKSIVIEKNIIHQKDKSKKIIVDKKKRQTPANQKKNKSSFGAISRKGDIQQQKRQQQTKKKTVSRVNSKEEESKKMSRKYSQSKIEKVEQKQEEEVAEEMMKNEEQANQPTIEKKELDIQQIVQIQNILYFMVEAVTGIVDKIKTYQLRMIQEEQKQQQMYQENLTQANNQYLLQQQLTMEIAHILATQEEQYAKSQHFITQIIMFLQNKMKLCLQSHIQHHFNFKIQVYGSQATALSITQSDIDLLAITTQSPSDLLNMFQAYQIFKQQQIQDVKFIKGATMPVIKLKMNQFFGNFNVDITFQMKGHTGIRCSELIQQFKSAEPLLKPLVIILKKIIYSYSLADPYTGGLGSYSLTLMVIALLQLTQIQKTRQNLGKIFLQFLFFYGFQLDYVCQAIIIHPPIPGFDYKPYYSIYQLPNTMDLTPKLVIYDPLNPVNNVGRTTYRIECLKNLFRVIYLRLKSSNLKIKEILQIQFHEIIQQIN